MALLVLKIANFTNIRATVIFLLVDQLSDLLISELLLIKPPIFCQFVSNVPSQR